MVGSNSESLKIVSSDFFVAMDNSVKSSRLLERHACWIGIFWVRLEIRVETQSLGIFVEIIGPIAKCRVTFTDITSQVITVFSFENSFGLKHSETPSISSSFCFMHRKITA